VVLEWRSGRRRRRRDCAVLHLPADRRRRKFVKIGYGDDSRRAHRAQVDRRQVFVADAMDNERTFRIQVEDGRNDEPVVR